MKKILDIGQCQPDHGAIRHLIEGNFKAQVDQAHSAEQAIAALRKNPFDLVLVNRKLDADYSDGLDIIKRIKADPQLSAIPVMLISNYQQYQQEAVDAGAEMGFGKSAIGKPETRESLTRFLG